MRDHDRAAGKPGRRLSSYRRTFHEVREDPTIVVEYLRTALLGIWIRRGAGFYGLGFLLTFIVLEVSMIVEDVSGSDGAGDFVVQQTLELAFRFSVMSFVNGLRALIWPAYVLEWLGQYGVLVLLAAYLAFEHGLRPVVERVFPELARARLATEAEKRQKKVAATGGAKARRKGKAARGDN